MAHAAEAVPDEAVDAPPAAAGEAVDASPAAAGEEVDASPAAAGLAALPEDETVDALPGDEAVDAPSAAAGLAAPPGDGEIVDGFDLADLDDLTEAPSHAHDIEQKIKATFPGAELTLLPESTDDAASGEAQRPSG